MSAIDPAIQQAAAIPVARGQLCLITSRTRKRWIVPKGCLEPNKTLDEIALQEAWEEAGLVGVLEPKPVGSYSYEKSGNWYCVTVFLMDVTQISDEWPEKFMRSRRWVSPSQALSEVKEPGLRRLLRRVLNRVPSAVTA
jgi:8-oxo-dGTP pyrophosphatase MutT (NUDIX family)